MVYSYIYMEAEIQQLIEELKKEDRYEVAEEIEKIYKLSVLEYSRSIYTYSPNVLFEPALENAFRGELSRLDYDTLKINKIISNLQTHRVLQTGPHITPSFGPRMLCQQWQSTIGLGIGNYYVVGMYSGVSFSSDFLPGHLVFDEDTPINQILREGSEINNTLINVPESTEKKLTLIPSKIQNDLVYRSEMMTKTREVVNSLTPELQKYFNIPSINGNSYTKWAMQTNQLLLGNALGKKNIVYIDINEVMTNYLLSVITDTNHIIYRTLFDVPTREKFVDHFKDVNIFYIPYMSGKYPSQEGLRIEGNFLVGKHTKIELSPDIIINALIDKRLCCGIFLTFTVLAFINSFKCLGGFRQAIYLPQFKKQWLKSGLLNEYGLTSVPTCNITTGFLQDSDLVHIRPLDIVLGKKFNPDPLIKVGELILCVSNNFLL